MSNTQNLKKTLIERIKLVINSQKELRDQEFNELALALFEHQYENNYAYKKLCDSQNFHNTRHWTEIPLLTTEAFKYSRQFCFQDDKEIKKVFLSSGTTEENRSKHFLSGRELEMYELSLWHSFSSAFRLVHPESHSKYYEYLVLTESPVENPNSSLIHMFECIKNKLIELGLTNRSQEPYMISNKNIKVDEIIARIKICQDTKCPVLLVGTAFSFMNLIDSLSSLSFNNKFWLPENSKIMETGGFKGKSKELNKSEFYELLCNFFGINMSDIIGQYGMSEMSSQYYDSFLLPEQIRLKKIPNWVRVRIINPLSPSKELKENEVGIICHYDLANIDSCSFLMSGDLGTRRTNDKRFFEIIGRSDTLSLKGCSLNYDFK